MLAHSMQAHEKVCDENEETRKEKKRCVHKTLLIVYGACVEKWYDRLQRMSG